MTIDPELKKEFKIIRKNQKTHFIYMMVCFLVVLVFVIGTHPASAQTITMSNPGGISGRDFMVYYPNGTMQGFYNDTSVITLDANESYIFTMKPIGANPLEDPGDWLTGTVFPFVQTNILALLILFILGAIWVGRNR